MSLCLGILKKALSSPDFSIQFLGTKEKAVIRPGLQSFHRQGFLLSEVIL